MECLESFNLYKHCNTQLTALFQANYLLLFLGGACSKTFIPPFSYIYGLVCPGALSGFSMTGALQTLNSSFYTFHITYYVTHPIDRPGFVAEETVWNLKTKLFNLLIIHSLSLFIMLTKYRDGLGQKKTKTKKPWQCWLRRPPISLLNQSLTILSLCESALKCL